MLGFVPDSYKDNTSDTIVWGPRGTIVLVVLRDGTLQNPDGSPSEYQDPFEYLLDHAAEIDQWYSPEQDETNIELTALGTERRVVQVAGIEIPFALLPNDYGLFLLIGRTMADIQSFETLLAGLLVSLEHRSGELDSEIDFDKLLEKNYTKTLGRLVKHFREHIGDPETADALAYARDRRNFLVHSLLRKYGWFEMSAADYRVCVQEISEIRSAIAFAEDRLIRYLNESQTLPVLRFEFDPVTGELLEDETAK
jgi:hypothetical protein